MLNNLVIINNRIVSGIPLIKNLYNTGEDILDALNNYVNGIWE